MSNPSGTIPPPPLDKIEVHYIKSNFFRVIFADGMYGGTTPRGLINVSLYNERLPIPKVTSLEVKQDGSTGSETDVDRLRGIVREVEADFVMSLATAEAFHTWLGQQIVSLKKIIAEQGTSK